MKTSIYIFLSLISLYISQNIITSWNYDKVAMYDIQKINNFLKSFAETPLEIPYTFTNNTLQINNIKLIQITTNLYDSLMNYNSELFLFSPNKISLNFNFTYTNGGESIPSTLELKILTFKLQITNDKEQGKNASFDIKMETPLDNYLITGIKDKDLLKALKELFYKGFNDNSVLDKFIPEKMEPKLYEHYSQYYKNIKDFKLQTKEFFGNSIINIKNDEFLYFCEDLLGEYKNSFCYYNGNVPDIEGSKEDKTLVPLKNERFSHNQDDLYNIFINNDLVSYSMDYMVKNYFEKNAKIYNNETNIKKLSYDFTVNSLNKYFKGLEKLKKEDKFDCEVYIEKGNLNEVIYKVRVNIRDEDKNYFEMRITSCLTLDLAIIKSVRFNICMKDTKTNNVEIISSSIEPKVEISDLDGLKKAIEESFDFKHNPICLNSEGISLKDYFAEITKAYIQEEGIYFEGPQLYQ